MLFSAQLCVHEKLVKYTQFALENGVLFGFKLRYVSVDHLNKFDNMTLLQVLDQKLILVSFDF